MELWSEELTVEERDALIEKAAHEIQKRKLEAPAILMLELHKPLAYVGGHAVVALSPLMVPFLGFDAVNNYSRLFADKNNIELLLQRIEVRSKAAKGVKEN